jgi:hypothetical protein
LAATAAIISQFRHALNVTATKVTRRRHSLRSKVNGEFFATFNFLSGTFAKVVKFVKGNRAKIAHCERTGWAKWVHW